MCNKCAYLVLRTRNTDSQKFFLTSCHVKYPKMKTRRMNSSNSFSSSYYFISVNLRNSLSEFNSHFIFRTHKARWIRKLLCIYSSHSVWLWVLSELTQQVVFLRSIKILLFLVLLYYQSLCSLQVVIPHIHVTTQWTCSQYPS